MSLKNLPSVEKVTQSLEEDFTLPKKLITQFVKNCIQDWRQRLLKEKSEVTKETIISEIQAELESFAMSRLQPVINATGVLIHTNLGRSPLGERSAKALKQIATGYSNLEFNLATGQRGKRAGYIEIVSRGELVEIGGGFRIPEIMETSGAILVEVGATNKTHLHDYENAITENTALILKVHRSNFYIDGFTDEPDITELRDLSKKHHIPLMQDIGSGAVMHTDQLAPIDHEPTPQKSLNDGIELICFSGDKLLGGPQSGILAGRADFIQGIKKEPFFRAVRCDKLILTVLQECIDSYLESADSKDLSNIPMLDFMRRSPESIKQRAEKIAKQLANKPADISVKNSIARTGGGTMPKAEIPSASLRIKPHDISVNKLATKLRVNHNIVGYTDSNELCFDLRTLFLNQDERLFRAIF